MHPSAWKGNSRKSICRILHNPGPIGPETPYSPDPAPNPKPYILWRGIKMRCGAYAFNVHAHTASSGRSQLSSTPPYSDGARRQRCARPPRAALLLLYGLSHSACGSQPGLLLLRSTLRPALRSPPPPPPPALRPNRKGTLPYGSSVAPVGLL